MQLKNNMKIAYHNPYPTTINAYRTINNGFERAFKELGHEFKYLTPDDNFREFFENYKPDLFITATHFLYQKYLDLDLLKKYRKENNLVVFAKLDFWKVPQNTNQARVSEAKGMQPDIIMINKIKDGLIADIFFHVVEKWDERMNGFEEATGYKFNTIPLAVDSTLIDTKYDKKWEADISFIGTNSPDKQEIFKEKLFPLMKKYNVKLYGQDWTTFDSLLGWVQRLGQYFNLPILKSIRKPKLKLEDEGNIYKSSKICINLHEKNQLIGGGDCNERTFKIPAYGGFQIVDDVKCIKDYLIDGEEIVISKDTKDWFEKIDYYINNVDARKKIIEAGKKKILENHTYKNRVKQIIKIYEKHVE